MKCLGLLPLLGALFAAALLAGCSSDDEQKNPDMPSSGGSAGASGAGSGGSSGSSGAGGGTGGGGGNGAVAGDMMPVNPMSASGGSSGQAGGGSGGSLSEPDSVEQFECAERAIDLESHSTHCGACGHACEPYVLASGLFVPYALALNATHAFWLTGAEGKVMSASLSSRQHSALADATSPLDLEIDAQSIYWVDDGSVWKMPLEGGLPVLLIAPTPDKAEAITLDGTHLYAALSGEQYGTGSIIKVALAGGEPTVLTTLPSMHPTSIAVDATHVYWGIGNSVGTLVAKVSIDGGVHVPVVMEHAFADAIAIKGESLYWSSYQSVSTGAAIGVASFLNKMPVAGGAILQLAQSDEQPSGIAIDAAAVYWATGSTNPDYKGVVQAVPLAGGSGFTLGPRQDTPLSVASNGTTVCWTTSTATPRTGSVRCLGACEAGACR